MSFRIIGAVGPSRASTPAALAMGLLGTLAGCEVEAPKERPWCLDSQGCYRSDDSTCHELGAREVASCDTAQEFAVCSATPNGCACHPEWALSQPLSVACDRSTVGAPSKCCADSGYPFTGICGCLQGTSWTCSGLEVEDCVEATTP
ncbi:MAG: hypothetical protein U0414_18330 [Polyangiaceae bacterium]